MKGILVPDNSTYVGLVELVRSVIGIRGRDKNIVMRYGVEPGLPLVRIQCDADVKFYIQLKKKDVRVLSKFPVTIDVLDESAAEAMPAEVGASNHIDVQRSRDGGQSDEAMQHVNDSNTIIPPPLQFPSPIVGLDLHNEYEIEKQDEVMHNDLCTAHDNCNAGEMHDADDSHRSNEKSIAASIGGHSIVNNTRSENDKVSSSDSLSDGVIVADYTPVTMSINCIFENKKLLQYHLHHDAMSKHYQFKVKRSNSTLLHVICIDNEGCQWQLRATRMRGSEMFVVKRFDDVHTCSIEIVQGHHRQVKSWMIGECVKAKYLDPTNILYRPAEIMRDMQDEFGVSFNYLRAWRGKEAALNRLRGDDAESYKVLPAWAEMVMRKNPASDIQIETDSENCFKYFYMCLAASKHGWPYYRPVIVVDGSALKARFGGMLLAACGHDANGSIFPLAFVNHVYPDSAFGICVQHLAANLKTRYKDFKGHLKTYFDGASRSYLLSEFHRHMESIRGLNPDMHRYLVEADPTKWSRAYFNGRRYAIMTTNIAESFNNVDRKARLMPVGFLPRPADQFEYAVTSNDGQIWIVDMSERTCTCRRFQVDQIHFPHAMAVCNYRRIDPYNYCSNYYTKDYLYSCYADVVHLIGSAEGWDVSDEVSLQIVNPPTTKLGPGRPRVRRIPSQGEEHEPIRCGRCNGYGHNRQTCTNSVPLRKRPTTRTDK
ncbi:hypothetical protein TIFTF001_051706 [Ficus carica]|uniref:Zinc finger PMZ-type domain-containing protein n=1 Tax=Ficus carica TaxID=3494 RepID=A0AA87ZAG3_FICCA|nr:hypothetical protein TIFTF001_051706 [Ficus carica]